MSKKPIVALLFSSGADSSESQYLATYLGCHLFWGGYSSIRLVPIKGEHQKSSVNTPTSSVLCVPHSNAGKVTKVEAGGKGAGAQAKGKADGKGGSKKS